METPIRLSDQNRRKASWLFASALLGVFSCGSDSATPPEPNSCENGFESPTPLSFDIPPGFPLPPLPQDNPLTVEGIALGRRLFYDPILSGDHTQSCSTCHDQAFAFSDHGQKTSDGINGHFGTRNTPAVINMAWSRQLFWDGRSATVEEQAALPVEDVNEMNLTWEEAVTRLSEHDTYPELFGKAFGTCDVTQERTVQAIAQFERTLVSSNSKYDRFNRGETTLSESEDRGYRLFFNERGDCFHCHGAALLTDRDFHDIGLDLVPMDPGLSHITEDPLDYGKFKTPTLRNIEFTAPYMHDGRFATLKEVVEHYNGTVQITDNLDAFILSRTQRDPLTDDELDDIVAFLRTFSDSAFVTNPDFSDPFQ